MLEITIPEVESYDEARQQFIYSDETTIKLEHSLVSISKWESKWNKIFLSNTPKTYEETLDYVRCMTITQNVNPDVYKHLTQENYNQINQYIDARMSATHVSSGPKGSINKEPVSSELIYYWMISYNIPFECQKWHLNRLLMLIEVCNFKNQPAKKMSKRELYSRHAAINAANRKRFNTTG